MGDAQPISERVIRRQGLFESLPFLSDNMVAKVCCYFYTIGVVLEINKFSYFAPLSSFKPKHKKMKESVDFIKIKDYAVININNMIPVPKEQLVELNINVEKDSHYKFLLQAEMRFRSKCLTFVKQHSNLDDWEYLELYASTESIKTDFQILFLAGNTLTNGSMDVKSHNLLLSLTMLYYHNC